MEALVFLDYPEVILVNKYILITCIFIFQKYKKHQTLYSGTEPSRNKYIKCLINYSFVYPSVQTHICIWTSHTAIKVLFA